MLGEPHLGSSWSSLASSLASSVISSSPLLSFISSSMVSSPSCSCRPSSVCQSSSLKNFIGLNRARRPHNAVFVSFTDASVPSECLEAAALNWRRVCVKEHDRKAEETLRQVSHFLLRGVSSGGHRMRHGEAS